MTAQVFLSHSSKDERAARTICAALENRGLRCWIAGRDVGPGENFQEAIVNAIRAAKVMVLVFTGHANNSDEIKKELVLASQNRLTIIPVRMEDVVPNAAFAYEFATRQWIDLFTDWEREIDRLGVWIAGLVLPKDVDQPVEHPAPKRYPTRQPLSAPSGSLRVIGILLIVQSLVRIGVQTNAAIQTPFLLNISFLLTVPMVGIQTFVIPGILSFGGIAAGVFALRRLPAARGFGLTICALNLLWSLYSLAGQYQIATKHNFPLVALWSGWTLQLAYIAIFLTGLVIFGRSRRNKVRP